MNTLIEFTALALSRPGPDALAAQVAAWYEAKARLHEHLAAAGGPDAPAEQRYAATAHEHARRLLLATGTPAPHPASAGAGVGGDRR